MTEVSRGQYVQSIKGGKQFISFKDYPRLVTQPRVYSITGSQAVAYKGKISTVTGDQKNFDVALVWQDAATGFSVMTSKRTDASFNAAADGKLKVLGMSIYAQWFEDSLKLVI